MAVEVRSHRLGATVRVAARPGAGRSAILGEHGGALKVALAAPPEKGKANKELVRHLAKALGLPRPDVELLSGETSRDKVVLIRNIEVAALAARIGALLAATGGSG
ncbi:MAG TPA: DUF167 domain-containing protein [Planctomycetota bacterium]|nr:DUF167 domain-containing protein [Planctomycetota bacterium]